MLLSGRLPVTPEAAGAQSSENDPQSRYRLKLMLIRSCTQTYTKLSTYTSVGVSLQVLLFSLELFFRCCEGISTSPNS